eukprot:GHVT01011102.1.p1 GENE.GHVT01011102.1~~GHVT01011102.1.p1  ORF type:complete len:467 (+),score=69.66 GHVT01011102.1:591-1991(+)
MPIGGGIDFSRPFLELLYGWSKGGTKGGGGEGLIQLIGLTMSGGAGVLMGADQDKRGDDSGAKGRESVQGSIRVPRYRLWEEATGGAPFILPTSYPIPGLRSSGRPPSIPPAFPQETLSFLMAKRGAVTIRREDAPAATPTDAPSPRPVVTIVNERPGAPQFTGNFVAPSQGEKHREEAATQPGNAGDRQAAGSARTTENAKPSPEPENRQTGARPHYKSKTPPPIAWITSPLTANKRRSNALKSDKAQTTDVHPDANEPPAPAIAENPQVAKPHTPVSPPVLRRSHAELQSLPKTSSHSAYRGSVQTPSSNYLPGVPSVDASHAFDAPPAGNAASVSPRQAATGASQPPYPRSYFVPTYPQTAPRGIPVTVARAMAPQYGHPTHFRPSAAPAPEYDLTYGIFQPDVQSYQRIRTSALKNDQTGTPTSSVHTADTSGRARIDIPRTPYSSRGRRHRRSPRRHTRKH